MAGAGASASTSTPTGRLAFFRSAVAAGSVALALDTNDGKDQDGSHAFVRSASDAKAPGRRIRREYKDRPHINSHCSNNLICAVINIRTWLTAS
jgi:hypothetical protein